MARRYYSDTAVDTTLTAQANAGASTFVLTSASGWPSAGAFGVVLDHGQATEEILIVTRSGTTCTLVSGTLASTHASGASAKHCIIDDDLEDAAAHRWDSPAAAGDTDAAAASIHHTVGATGDISTQAFGDAAAAGASFKAAGAGHKHGMPANPVTAHEGAADPHTVYVLESLIDAKGDLIAGSADNTTAKLTVGANDTILMADSAEATGLKWVAAAAPGESLPGDAATAGSTDGFARPDHKHGRAGEKFARKTADETLNNNATLQNDDHLLVALGANETWVFEAYVIFTSAGTSPDLSFEFTVPAGATLHWGHVTQWDAALTMQTSNDRTGGLPSTIGASSSNRVTVMKGIVRTAGTAGNLQLQWAQATAVAEDTTVRADSYIQATKVA